MQQYRERMKARGLMQVTVWSSPENAGVIRHFAQSLLDAEAATDTQPLSGPSGMRDQLDDVTGDKQRKTLPPLTATGQDDAHVTGGILKDSVEARTGAAGEAKVETVTGDETPTLSAATEDDDAEPPIDPMTDPRYVAALDEIRGEVANWEREMEGVDEAEQHAEVLQELRQWLKESETASVQFREALQQLINERRKA
jgi:hypothetical protein